MRVDGASVAVAGTGAERTTRHPPGSEVRDNSGPSRDIHTEIAAIPYMATNHPYPHTIHINSSNPIPQVHIPERPQPVTYTPITGDQSTLKCLFYIDIFNPKCIKERSSVNKLHNPLRILSEDVRPPKFGDCAATQERVASAFQPATPCRRPVPNESW